MEGQFLIPINNFMNEIQDKELARNSKLSCTFTMKMEQAGC